MEGASPHRTATGPLVSKEGGDLGKQGQATPRNNVRIVNFLIIFALQLSEFHDIFKKHSSTPD